MIEFKDRLAQVINNECNGSQKEFIERTGITQSGVSEYLSGKKKNPRREFFIKIQKAFPNISQSWLLSGEDPMYQTDNKRGKTDQKKYYSSNEYTHTLVYCPISASAGYMDLVGNYTENLPSLIFTKEFEDCDTAFDVAGDSMSPSFKSGDIVAGKRLYNFEYARPGEAYVLDYGDGFVIKRVYHSENPDYLRLVSTNETYTPYEILKNDIRGMWLIRGVLSTNIRLDNSNDSLLKLIHTQLLQTQSQLNKLLGNQ